MPVPPFTPPGRVTRVLACVVALFALASLVLHYLRLVRGHDTVLGLAALLDLDGEGNLPAWYSSSMLLVCALLLARIAAAARTANDRFHRHWAALAAAFAVLSCDEAVGLHELTTSPLREALGVGGGPLHFAWVVLAVPLLVGLGIAYRRFLGSLPARTRRLFLLAGGLFVAGAVGVEIVEGPLRVSHGMYGLPFLLCVTVEETLEMAGVVVFVHALLERIERLERPEL